MSVRNVENLSWEYQECGEPTPRNSTHAMPQENIPPYVPAELLTLSKIVDTNLLLGWRISNKLPTYVQASCYKATIRQRMGLSV